MSKQEIHVKGDLDDRGEFMASFRSITENTQDSNQLMTSTAYYTSKKCMSHPNESDLRELKARYESDVNDPLSMARNIESMFTDPTALPKNP